MLVGHHGAVVQFAPLLESLYERGEALHLFGCGGFCVEVADQANSEAHLVLSLAGEVAAVELAYPAVPGVDCSVLHAVSVADNEMVGETVFHVAHAGMVIGHAFDGGLRRRAVMDDDSFPASRFDRRVGNCLGDIGGQGGAFGGCVRFFGRNAQPLTRDERRGGLKSVARGKDGDSDIVFIREAGESVSPFHRVYEVPCLSQAGMRQEKAQGKEDETSSPNFCAGAEQRYGSQGLS